MTYSIPETIKGKPISKEMDKLRISGCKSKIMPPAKSSKLKIIQIT